MHTSLIARKPHIFIVSSWYPTESSSSGTFMEELILALLSRNFRVAMLISEEITLGNFIRRKLKNKPVLDYRKHAEIDVVENLTVHRWPLRWKNDPESARLAHILNHSKVRFQAYVDRCGKPDILFHHGIFDYTYITRELSRAFSIPYWFKEHSSYINSENFPCANDFESPESLVSFVQGAKRRFAASSFYVAKMRQVFGVDFEYLPNTLSDSHFIHDLVEPVSSPFTFLNVSIMVPIKNQQLIIRAFARAFPDEQDACRLIIAGDGKLHEDLTELCAELGKASQISVLKFQNRAEIRSLLAKAQAFVLASDLETFGVVLIEAMGFGLPVISSRIPGPMDFVNDSNGLFFEAGSEEDLAEAMLKLYRDYDQYDKSAIKSAIKNLYGPDSAVKILGEERAMWKIAEENPSFE